MQELQNVQNQFGITAPSASPRAVCGAMNRLILACRNDAHAQDAAAEIVSDVEQRDLLTGYANRRGVFVRELSKIVHALGGRARASGSTTANMAALLRRFRSVVIGVHEGDAYGVCARLEAKAERRYDDALLVHLPDAARTIVERQRKEIAHDAAELRSKWFLQ